MEQRALKKSFIEMMQKRFASNNGLYEETHAFDKEIVKRLGNPYELSKFQLMILGLVNKVGLSNVGWHKELRKNNALDKRLDRTFL